MTTSIIRHRRRHHFTTLPNSALRDPRLSFRATGLLAYLLSLPSGVSTNAARLAERKLEGRDAVRTAMRELMDTGYVKRWREQRQDGTWVYVTEVADDADFQPNGAEEPSTGNPSPVDQAIRDQELDVRNKGGVRNLSGTITTDDDGRLWVTEEGL